MHIGLNYSTELYFTGVVLALAVLCLVGKSTQSYQSVLGIPTLSLSLSLSLSNETCYDLRGKHLSNNTGTAHYDSLQGSCWADQKDSHNEVIMTSLQGQ